MVDHVVTGRCAGVAAGMDPCSRPCGQRECPVSCCDEHRKQYGPETSSLRASNDAPQEEER